MPNVQLKPGEAPPPDYYRTNLIDVCGYVLNAHRSVLEEDDLRWLAALRDAGVPAQRLFARLVMRKGPLFRTDKLAYTEIDDMALAIQSLVAGGLAERNARAPADQVLALLLKAELGTLTAARGRKEDLVADVLSRLSDEQIRQRLAGRLCWLRLAGLETLRKVELLYFGRSHRDLAEFVLRDLGLVRYEEVPHQPDLAPFADLPSLTELQRLRRLQKVAGVLESRAELAPWVLRATLENRAPFKGNRHIERVRNTILNSLGRWGERNGARGFALACYRQSDRHPARERMVRLLVRGAVPDSAETLLREIHQAPFCREERVFAERFGKRNAGYQPAVTVRELPDPDMEMTPGAIERVALAVLARDGSRGMHVENTLPLGLCGLAYWPAIFAPVPGAFSNPMQSGPNDLFWEDFAAPRATLIDRCTAALRERPERLLETWREKQGLACGLVHWAAFSEATVELLVRSVPAEQLAALARYTVEHLYSVRTGFPDLFVVHADGAYEFVEVKGPNDALQPQQRAWFETLEQLGLPARVLKFRA